MNDGILVDQASLILTVRHKREAADLLRSHANANAIQVLTPLAPSHPI